MDNSSEKIRVKDDDSPKNSTKNRSIEGSNFKDKDDEQSIQDLKIETQGSAENNVKNKNVEDDKPERHDGGHSAESNVTQNMQTYFQVSTKFISLDKPERLIQASNNAHMLNLYAEKVFNFASNSKCCLPFRSHFNG